MNYQCHRCQADLTVGLMGCSECGMRFAAPVPPLASKAAVPGVAAAPVTPSWVQPQPPQKSVADSVPREPRPRQPLPPLEAPPLFDAKPPTVTPPSRRRKKRLIAAVAVVVAGLLFTGIYNVWDTVLFPHHPDPPMSAHDQAIWKFQPFVPTPSAPAAAVQQAPAVPQMTDKQRADAEIAAAQGRYTADKAAQQQAAYAPSPSTIDEISGGQARPIISNDQADQQMEALYDMGESSYQRSKSSGSSDPSMGVDGLVD